MERDEILKKLTILDFMAVDLALYLDTHPQDKEAITKYNETIVQADKVRCLYEKQYGPLCSYRSLSKERWTWDDDPWPWCKDFNFELCGEERY